MSHSPIRRLYGIKVPRGDTWQVKVGKEALDTLVDRFSRYRFCQPIPQVMPPLGMFIINNRLAAKKTINHEGLYRDSRVMFSR